MKRTIIAISFVLAFVLASCDKENTSPTDTIPERAIPTGNIPTPEWTVAPGYDYTSSMTAVVEVDLTSTYPDITPVDWQVDTADRMAAFAGDECIGVTSPFGDLFFLYIVSPTQNDANIKLWYYSAQLHNVFLANTVFHFENGGRIGTVVEPLTPLFTASSR